MPLQVLASSTLHVLQPRWENGVTSLNFGSREVVQSTSDWKFASRHRGRLHEEWRHAAAARFSSQLLRSSATCFISQGYSHSYSVYSVQYFYHPLHSCASVTMQKLLLTVGLMLSMSLMWPTRVLGLPSGATSAACGDLTQRHGSKAQTSTIPYEPVLDPFLQAADMSFGYIPGNTYTCEWKIFCQQAVLQHLFPTFVTVS